MRSSGPVIKGVAPLKKILIVDDEVHLVKILEFTLQHAGFEVISCHNGHEAVEMIISEKPDLAILDLMLPGLDGFEVCRRIKGDERVSAIPVIMLSARDYSEEGLEGSLPAESLMRKPFNTDKLIQTIRELTG
ncbi:MAG: response regulator [Candidatus Latescibacteria bacterium]|nr:response regulator [bacterium]MBD3423035.1 response regulator [Candidatus Latescibacterota bacterium]